MKNSTVVRLLFTGLVLLISSPSVFADAFPVTVTDVAGRTITIEKEPQNIAISTGRVFPLLEMIYQQDAASHLVAWRDDMRTSAPSMYASYVKDFPQLKEVLNLGKIKSGEFDTERFIQMKNKPDLFVVDIVNVKLAEEEGLFNKLNKAGIKVLVVDFRENPIKNTVQSVTSLATAVGRKEQGQKFARYYQAHLETLLAGIATVPKEQLNRKVFVERSAGKRDSCCETFSAGNMGEYIPFLKATNIADKPLKGAFSGKMSAESLIVAQPDIYIMQTTGWIDKNGTPKAGIPLGYNANLTAIKSATNALLHRSWMVPTPAYQNKNVYSIYMPFYNSPYNLVALEYFAKWIYPEQFKNLNPELTFEEMNKTLANRTVNGVFGQDNFKVIQK
ncbi:cobalamin ABC transporter substrate-binding protein [Vibrio sp. UCD-FRSSP16_10]|uniref:ABC transporter substrate-binding protein n=1 Tax=unclassified Vibrio TaxID=2614977 RepID=UPI0007FFF6AA|nr:MULTISPECIES: ABC transporter substrate-binding protein [unclassified Vibrio]OBT17204.1 cobalamin ABC transporter substrate-binding protein [Vibrio sp. UCD-FRSSP16_30]OBT22973.1 cobalamin ABC transporter substrate-binding protein [Vibrio sp. UCD-FRSSP16_10]